MNQGVYRRNLPQNPIVRALAALVALLAAIGAIFLGAVVVFFLVGFAVLVWVIVSVRLWWLGRKMTRRDGGREPSAGEIVEVEYTVVEERSARQEPRD
ncbi:MAG TPA: hypothetical protein VIV14_01185 [Gammaproteobacteria bacterium]